MRGALIISLLIAWSSVFSQEKFHDPSQYAAFLEGEWKTVLTYAKLAKKEKKDYYYLRYRNGYAKFMLGKYRESENEFKKALAFNSADTYSKHFLYWSMVFAGENDAARLVSSKFSKTEKDTIGVRKPSLISSISALGGYRISTSPNRVTGMPYAELSLGHEIGGRLRLRQSVGYLNVSREDISVWQIGYLGQIGIQVGTSSALYPFFQMQYWESGLYKIYDLAGGLSFRQRFGNVGLSVFGAYIERTREKLFQGGVTLSWYPLGNSKFYIKTTNSVNGGVGDPLITSRETIGGNLYKGLWLKASLIIDNELIPFEDSEVGFANNSLDSLNWRASSALSYEFKSNWSISATYLIESRVYTYETLEGVLRSDNYNYHGLFLGLTKRF